MSLLSSRFAHPYYGFNFLLILCYFLLRLKQLQPGDLSLTDMFGITRESQIYFSLSLLLFSRLLSAPTADAYLSSLFMFTRAAILLCLYFMSIQYFVLFLALWTLLYLLIPQPRPKLPRSVQSFTAQSFKTRVLDSNYDSFYVVWLHAPWSTRCSHLLPPFVRLAQKYEHPRMIFGRLDVSKFPNVAHDLEVSTKIAGVELPAVLLFNKGKEIARLPKKGESAKWKRGFKQGHLEGELGLPECLEKAKKWEKQVQDKYKNKKSN